MSGDVLTWAAALFLGLYAFGLGANAVIVWRLYRGPARYLVALATLAYYWALHGTRHPAWIALLDGTPYPAGDAVRTIAASVAFGLGLLMVARKTKGKA